MKFGFISKSNKLYLPLKSIAFLTYFMGFSAFAGARILYCRAVVLFVVKTPISLLATFLYESLPSIRKILNLIK